MLEYITCRRLIRQRDFGLGWNPVSIRSVSSVERKTGIWNFHSLYFYIIVLTDINCSLEGGKGKKGVKATRQKVSLRLYFISSILSLSL
jgi:hypothetical protein